MKTRTVVERIGENMGPIDWNYDFRSHFNNMCTSDAGRDEACARKVAILRDVVDAIADGRRVSVQTHGDFGHEVLDVGMYDGWPYWKPTPSLFLSGPLGGEWKCFANLTGMRIVETEGRT